MKPKGCGPRNLGSPFKQTKNNKSLGDSLKDYFAGNQGLVPDFITGGKPTRQAMNESTILNPRSSDEHRADMSDSRMRASLQREQNTGSRMSSGSQKMLNYYNSKAKQTRPNRKNRY